MNNDKQMTLDNRNNNNSNNYRKEKEVHIENNVEKLLKDFDKISDIKKR